MCSPLRQNVLPKSAECAAQLPQCAAQLPQCAAHLRQCAAELRDYLLPPKSCPRDIHVHPRAEMTKVLLARQVVPPTFAIVGPTGHDAAFNKHKRRERAPESAVFRSLRVACDASRVRALRPQLPDVRLMEGAYPCAWTSMAYYLELTASMARAVNNNMNCI
ncbi:unnamed protein product [Heligmosomoides polygyrus]|uniref:Hist_deacetyl domain-containing protein n=1 Tax=Heligmosomoides polygyrus TaxID=6339 RepID=A0A183F3D6_HELPZ|nr:unnamed protein product [Heligmosomoides polygyrus]